MENQLPEASWKERILFFLGRRQGFVVKGNSMLPTLKDGDAVLINPRAEVESGDIVLVNNSFNKGAKILKRIDEISTDEKFSLTSDNPNESSDSQTVNKISKSEIFGKVTCRLK